MTYTLKAKPVSSLKGDDFIHLIMQHVLPRKFRRVRDYGFLHGNAKKILSLVALVLHIKIVRPKEVPVVDPHAVWCGGWERKTPGYPIKSSYFHGSIS